MGLQPVCLRLTRTVAGACPRLDTGCGGPSLPRKHFHPLAKKRLVAHNYLTCIGATARLAAALPLARGGGWPGRGVSSQVFARNCLRYMSAYLELVSIATPRFGILQIATKHSNE